MPNQTLEIYQHLFGYEPKGFLALKQFCRAVDAGEAPDPEFLQTCSRAFKKILAEDVLKDGLMFFAGVMDLNKRPGVKPTSRKEDERLALVMDVLYLEREGLTHGKAKKEIVKKGDKSLRSIQRYYKKYESDARWFFKNFKI